MSTELVKTEIAIKEDAGEIIGRDNTFVDENADDSQDLHSITNEQVHLQEVAQPVAYQQESTEPIFLADQHHSIDKKDGITYDHTNVNQEKVPPPVKRAITNFPWLLIQWEACYSSKQETSGLDLTGAKKKYRRMQCLYCAEFNPNTRWALMNPRKFEHQVFKEHQESNNHKKAVQHLFESKGMEPPAEVLASMEFSNPIITGETKLKTQKKRPLSTGGNIDGVDLMADSSDSEGELVLGKQPTPVARKSAKKPRKDNVIVNPDGVVTTVSPSVNRRMVKPVWLETHGTMCYSQRQQIQADAGTIPAHVKKKYKKLRCLYCAEFNPDSIWAQVLPRKCESAVLIEHERSQCHQKALRRREEEGITDETPRMPNVLAPEPEQEIPPTHNLMPANADVEFVPANVETIDLN